MNDARSDLAKLILQFSPAEGVNTTPLPGVYCIKFTKPDRRSKRHWRACFGIVAQGGKEIILGGEVYRCAADYYTASPVDLPVISSILSATPAKPFLALLIGFDALMWGDVAAQIEKEFAGEIEMPLRALFMGKACRPMLEAAVRLAKLFQTPADAPVLGPLVVKEILYHLLKGPDGPAIRQYVRSGSARHKISQAIYRLNSDLSEEVDVNALARAAGMSRSAFFKHFKEVSAMSPIQYQKRLRLLEARRLLTANGETAERSAFKVGYHSASQFSREYSRMFGNPPLRDAVKVKKRIGSGRGFTLEVGGNRRG